MITLGMDLLVAAQMIALLNRDCCFGNHLAFSDVQSVPLSFYYKGSHGCPAGVDLLKGSKVILLFLTGKRRAFIGDITL